MDRQKLYKDLYNAVIVMLVCLNLCFLALTALDQGEYIIEMTFWNVSFAVVIFVKNVIGQKNIIMFLYGYLSVIMFLLFVIEKNFWLIVFAFTMGIMCYVLFEKTKNTLMRDICGLVELVMLLAAFAAGIQIPDFLVVLTLFITLNSIYEILVLCKVSSCNNSFMSVLFGVMCFLLFFAPVKEEPVEWTFFYEIAERFEDWLADMKNLYSETDGVFSFAYMEYSEEADAYTGRIVDSNRTQLTLAGATTSDNLYLKGNVLDSFDGRRWKNANEQTTLSDEYDAYKTLYACFTLLDNPKEMDEFVSLKRQNIVYGDIKTKSLFVPLKNVSYGGSNLKADRVQKGDNLRTQNINRRGFDYYYMFFYFDYSNELFWKVLSNADKVVYSENKWNQMVQYVHERFGFGIDVDYNTFYHSISEADKRISLIYGNDVQNESEAAIWNASVKETGEDKADSETVGNNSKDNSDDLKNKGEYELSSRVKRITDRVTENENSDISKCAELVNYLNKLQYSRQIEIPAGTDIVEWFLIDGRQGYCVQFATALTQMLRYCGIPARLVEGFMVDYSYKSDEGDYLVRGLCSHAWVEAYIKGAGWITLDATRKFPCDINQSHESNVSDLQPDNLTDYGYNELQDEMDDEDSQDTSDSITENDYKDEGTIEESDTGLLEYLKRWNTVLLYLGIFVLTVLFVVILVIVALRVRKRKIMKASNPDVVIKEIMRCLDVLTVKRKEDQTLRDYFKSICSSGFTIKKKAIKEGFGTIFGECGEALLTASSPATDKGLEDKLISETEKIFYIIERYTYSEEKISDSELEKLKYMLEIYWKI